ncbi:hypothetical protein D3C78_551890 [compost metagenome]
MRRARAQDVDLALEGQPPFVARIEGGDGLHLALGAVEIPAAQGNLSLALHIRQAAQLFDLAQRLAGALVVRFDAEHPLVTGRRRSVVACRPGAVGLGQQGGHHPATLGGQGHLRAGIARRYAGLLLQGRQALLVVAFVDQLDPVAYPVSGAASQHQQRQHDDAAAAGGRSDPGNRHSLPPTDKVWRTFSGR